MSIKLLIAEDDESMRQIWSIAFEHAGGFDINVAKNGQEALMALGGGVPEVLVTDYHMPIFSGLELARTLRVMPGGANTLVIMVTADDTVRRNTEAHLADIVLIKPLDFRELVRVAVHLREKVS